MQNLDGTWLMIKSADNYSSPEFIEFHTNKIIHFELEKTSEDKISKKTSKWEENLSESKYEFVNDNRIRIYRMGKTHKVISKKESITRDIEFATDYERIITTKTKLSVKKIQELEFEAEWNDNKFLIIFNKNLDSPIVKEINKKFNREGKKLVLENLQGTYFVSIFEDGYRETLIGIKEIDEEKAILFGFPDLPYEITAKSIKKH